MKKVGIISAIVASFASGGLMHSAYQHAQQESDAQTEQRDQTLITQTKCDYALANTGESDQPRWTDCEDLSHLFKNAKRYEFETGIRITNVCKSGHPDVSKNWSRQRCLQNPKS